jgi:hypothetical protein
MANFTAKMKKQMNVVNTAFSQLATGTAMRTDSQKISSAYAKAISHSSALADLNTKRTIRIPLQAFEVLTGAEGTAALSGTAALLHLTSLPKKTWDTSYGGKITFQTAGTPTIGTIVTLPDDFTGNSICYVKLYCQNTTSDVKPIHKIFTNWDGGSEVADLCTTSTVTSWGWVTATIAAADVPTSAYTVALRIQPGTHVNAVDLLGVKIKYTGSNA